jgi:AsmA protein
MPVIAGTLAFDTLDLGAFLAGFTPLEDKVVSGAPADFSTRVGLDLRLSAAAAQAGPVALTDLAATVQVKPMFASFDISDAQAYGGRFQGSLRLDRQPELDQLELKLMGSELSGAAIAAAAPSIPLVPTAQGNLALTLKGSGNRWRDLLETGTGTASISFGEGAIPDFDLTAFASRLDGTGFFPLSEVAKGALPIKSIKFKAAIARGVALIETGEINAPNDSILLTGLVPYIGGGLALSGRLQSPQPPGDGQPGHALAVRTFFVGGSWSEPFVAPIGNSPAALPAD